MTNRRDRRPVSGVLLLDKPVGWTSNAALQAVKRLYQAQKAGHTGSLDPLASGLLPKLIQLAAAEKAARSAAAPARERAAPRPRASSRQTPMEALTKSVLRTAGTTITRELLRGVLGSLKRR